MESPFAAVMRRSRGLVPCLALAALAWVSPARAEQVRNHFDSDSVMRAPGFFDFMELGAPGTAKWLILTDPNPPSAPNMLVQVEAGRPADAISAAVRRNYAFLDGTVSTFVKRNSGREGLVLRLKDPKNYVALFVDSTGDVFLTSCADGKVQELGRAKTAFDHPWERYSVQAKGPVLEVFFNDQKLFDARDPHPASGRTGLAAAGPGQASFDEFLIEPADAAPKN